jgi:chorismate mutase/prephenate dehydratase
MSIEIYRSKIDNIDNDILNLLESRKIYSKLISKIKAKNNQNLTDLEREEEIINRLKSRKSKLKENQIENIFKMIINECKV